MKKFRDYCGRFLLRFLSKKTKTIRVMKLIIFLSLLTISQLWATETYSQMTKLTIKLEDVKISDALLAIENQSEFFFLYSPKLIDVTRKVDIVAENKPIKDILSEIFGKEVQFTVYDRQIILFPTGTGGGSESPQHLITGTVVDKAGTPLPGVSVSVKGSTTGITTDINGKFSLMLPPDAEVLIFSFIGMQSQELNIGTTTQFKVTMSESQVALSEVVVIGYGTQKKESVTSAVSAVSNTELKQVSVASLSSTVLGRVSGVTADQDNGAPGDDQSRIYIRGLATTGSIDPLYVIDGIPRSALDFNNLSPNEIQSISVLKDAAAAAVYGARGANGVILVTSNRGAAGKTSFTLSYDYANQKSDRLPKYMGSYDYANLFNQALINEGKEPVFSNSDLTLFQNGSDPIFHPNTDWLKPMRGSAPMQKFNLSATGGSETVQYFISFNMLNQENLLHDLNSSLGYNRYSFRSNINAQATKTTKISLDVSGYVSDKTEPGYYFNVFSPMLINPPNYVAQYPNGLFGAGFNNNNGWARAAQSGYYKDDPNALLTKFEITQDIPFIKGLSLKGVAAYDYKPEDSKFWTLKESTFNAVQNGNSIEYDPVGGSVPPTLSEGRDISTNLVLEAHAIYNRSFGNHGLSALVLYSQQAQTDNTISAFRGDYLTQTLSILDAGSTTNQETSGTETQYRRRSVVGRLSYDYSKRYLLEFDFREDGSDLFAPGKRWGFFPALSAGWLISNENFMKSVSFINRLKLRGSYGLLGNDNIGQYQYLDFYQFSPAGTAMGLPDQRQNEIYLARMANNNVTWENSRKTDFGIESTILKNITFEFDLFYENRNNILGQRSSTIPATVGVSYVPSYIYSGSILPYENFEKVDNKGYEFVIGYHKQFSNKLELSTRLTVSHNQNKVIDIGESPDVPDRIKQAGRSLYPLYGYHALGIFKTQAEIDAAYHGNYPDLKPGDIHYADLNGDGKIDGNDITYLGGMNLPKYVYGWQTILSYSGFDFTMFWQAGVGGKQDMSQIAIPFYGGGNALVAAKDYWSPTNPNAAYPRITTTSSWNYDQVSDFWVKDMSYLRLKNVGISYVISNNFLRSMKIQSARLGFNITNLLTFSPFKEVDPENSNFGGVNYFINFYPQQRVSNFELSFTF